MTPDELAAYQKWKREHEPTSAADRARKRALRRQDLEARKSIERLASEPARPKSPEAIELQERIDALKAELSRAELKGGVFE